MDHHLDLRLLPDPEFGPQALREALYAKLHRALAAGGCTGIGVSFPAVQGLDLGLCLRLHGTQAGLAALMDTAWLRGMRDHLTVGEIGAVPAQARHRCVSRRQSDSSPERLRRRLMRRHSIDEAEARERIPDSTATFLKLPSLQLRSTSTGQHFRLFIHHGPLQDTPTPGAFNAYGLSATATVPWF